MTSVSYSWLNSKLIKFKSVSPQQANSFYMTNQARIKDMSSNPSTQDLYILKEAAFGANGNQSKAMLITIGNSLARGINSLLLSNASSSSINAAIGTLVGLAYNNNSDYDVILNANTVANNLMRAANINIGFLYYLTEFYGIIQQTVTSPSFNYDNLTLIQKQTFLRGIYICFENLKYFILQAEPFTSTNFTKHFTNIYIRIAQFNASNTIYSSVKTDASIIETTTSAFSSFSGKNLYFIHIMYDCNLFNLSKLQSDLYTPPINLQFYYGTNFTSINSQLTNLGRSLSMFFNSVQKETQLVYWSSTKIEWNIAKAGCISNQNYTVCQPLSLANSNLYGIEI